MTGEHPMFVVIGFSGLRELLAWAVAAPTSEQREQRATFAKECVAEALAGGDHDEMNRQIRSALRSDPFATPTSATASPRN